MSTEPELTPWQARLTEHFLAGGTVEMRHSLRGGAYWYLKPAPKEQTPASTEPCGAVPPPSIYGRGVYVAPCTLAPGHSGTHLPGNMDELNALPRGRNRRNPNPPMYPGAQSSVPRGPAIDVEHEHTPACDPQFGIEDARAAAEAFQAAYPELMKIIRGRTVTPDDAQPAPNVGTDRTMYPRKDA